MLAKTLLVLSLSYLALGVTIDKFFATTEPTLLSADFDFTEGPLWRKETQTLLFSDIVRGIIYEGDFSVDPPVINEVRNPSIGTNGLAFDLAGNLISCHYRSIARSTEPTFNAFEIIADTYLGNKLNSPNDIAVKSDGSIYFTDPAYGIGPEEEELGFNGLWRITPDGVLEPLIQGTFLRPNGLAFSPGETRLYVGDSGRNNVRVFDVDENGTLSNSQIFDANVEAPDGLAVDIQGHVYISTATGISVYQPSGAFIGQGAKGTPVSNLCFGGLNNTSIYFTGGGNVYVIEGLIEGNILGVAQTAEMTHPTFERTESTVESSEPIATTVEQTFPSTQQSATETSLPATEPTNPVDLSCSSLLTGSFFLVLALIACVF